MIETCCPRFAAALTEDLIRLTDSHGHYHLTPTESGVSNPQIHYCPFCGRKVKDDRSAVDTPSRIHLAAPAGRQSSDPERTDQ